MRRRSKSSRATRRTTFGRAATYDLYLDGLRRDTRASTLGAVDWMLHRHPACPWRSSGHAGKAYTRAFNAERAQDPRPAFPPIPDLPRARAPYNQTRDVEEASNELETS
jgi:hypothetical protein